MQTVSSPTVVKLSKATDQKAEILKLVGDLSKFTMLGSDVMVATYIEPEKTKGGVWMPEKRADESRYQGKCGLIIAKGHSAFKYDGAYAFDGPSPNIGDWVFYFPTDGRELFFRGVSCRIFNSQFIRGIVPDPDFIF